MKKFDVLVKRLKDKLFGRKRYHLIEPYTVWADRKLNGEVISYRKVYYCHGRKNSPFHRRYGKGIQVSGHGIQPYESFELYAEDKAFDEYMDRLAQITLPVRA